MELQDLGRPASYRELQPGSLFIYQAGNDTVLGLCLLKKQWRKFATHMRYALT
jgi:hypothetical protein